MHAFVGAALVWLVAAGAVPVQIAQGYGYGYGIPVGATIPAASAAFCDKHAFYACYDMEEAGAPSGWSGDTGTIRWDVDVSSIGGGEGEAACNAASTQHFARPPDWDGVTNGGPTCTMFDILVTVTTNPFAGGDDLVRFEDDAGVEMTVDVRNNSDNDLRLSGTGFNDNTNINIDMNRFLRFGIEWEPEDVVTVVYWCEVDEAQSNPCSGGWVDTGVDGGDSNATPLPPGVDGARFVWNHTSPLTGNDQHCYDNIAIYDGACPAP